ncbi:hypothetical protein SSS_06523 [Sarcoptes scabiei]|nr:hypothetical protein SSS_06523 [Sarcoptes scabiei]
MIQSRRRKRNDEILTNGLDSDESIKLCRLIKMYRIQSRLKKSSSENLASIALYRIDPKVLVNLLEEVSFAFGTKTNWLENLERDTMNLWSAFITNGLAGLRSLGSSMKDYDPNTSTSSLSVGEKIDLINIGQKSEEENRSETSVKTIQWNELCRGTNR